MTDQGQQQPRPPPYPSQQQADYPPPHQPSYSPQQQADYPMQQQPSYHPQQQPSYPPQQQASYPPQQQVGYPPQQQVGYPPQQPAGYPLQQQAGYPLQQQAGNPLQQPANYPPQQQPQGAVVQQPTVTTTAYTRHYGSGDHGLMFSIVASVIVFCCCACVGLFCTIPAIFVAISAQNAEQRGDLTATKSQERLSVGLTVTGLITGFVCLLIYIIVGAAT